jgi:hypothetical protein
MVRAEEEEGIPSLVVEGSVLAGRSEIDEYTPLESLRCQHRHADVIMALLERLGDACFECRRARSDRPLCCWSIKRARW